jgi:hypothetical protein
LTSWFPRWSTPGRALPAACGHAQVPEPEIMMIVHRCDRRITPADVRDSFYYSLGDWDVQ